MPPLLLVPAALAAAEETMILLGFEAIWKYGGEEKKDDTRADRSICDSHLTFDDDKIRYDLQTREKSARTIKAQDGSYLELAEAESLRVSRPLIRCK